MIKKALTYLTVLLVALAFAVPAQAEFKDMWAKVYKRTSASEREDALTEVTSGITFKVLQRNSETAETLYYYNSNAFTSLTNPVTTANFASNTVMRQAGEVSFRVDPGESGDRYVDLIVVNTVGGYTAFVPDFDEYSHRIILDQRPMVQHHGMIWFSGQVSGATTATVTDTGVNFEAGTWITNVWRETSTISYEDSIDIGLLSTGLGGDDDGFLDGCSISNALQSVYGDSSDPSLTIDVAFYSIVGAFLDANLPTGARNMGGHLIQAGRSSDLVYATVSVSNPYAATARGYIHYTFVPARTTTL